MTRTISRLVALCALGASLASAAQTSPPTLSSVSPASGPTQGNIPITLSGTNLDTVTSATIGTSPCPIVTQDLSYLICTLPAGEGLGHPVSVTNPDGTADSLSFDYAAPVLASVSPATGPTAGGTSITLSGQNFGLNPFVAFDSDSCAITSHDHTHIVCVPPPGTGTGHLLRVTVAGQQSGTMSWRYLPPSIASISPSAIPTSGALITLTGNNFGASGAWVFVDGAACPVTSQTHTSIECAVPAGTGLNKTVTVNVDGQSSNSATLSYQAPVLSSVTPSNGHTAGGDVLTLSGTNFGTSGGVVTVGGATCPLTLQTHQQIECTLPAGQGTGHPVQVTVAGQSSNTVSYDYGPPSISSLTPSSGPTAGGTALTLVGENFGVTGGSVTVGGQSCPITSQGHTLVMCTAPSGTGTNQLVTLTVDGRSTTASQTYSYAAPTLTSLTPTSGPTAGGITLTLSGSSFGASGATVQVGGAACPVTAQTQTSLECTLPEGQGVSRPVVVTVDGQSSNGAVRFNYAAPVLTQVSPTTGPTSGGTPLTLTGSNFGISGAQVTVDGASCAVQSQSHGQITCSSPAGSGTNRPVIVTVAGQSSNTGLFTYAAPSLSQLQPSTGPTAGGFTLTLTGQNFGSSGQVDFGSTPCPVSSWSDSQVTCTAPEGLGENIPVKVLVGGQSSNAMSFSYDAPTLVGVTPSVGPLAGGASLTLSGSSFGAQGATVALSGVDCPVTAQLHTQLECTLPAGAGPNKQLVVTAADGRPSNALSFSYASSPPVASSGTLTTDEDVEATATLVATDLDGDPLTYQVVGQPPVGEGSVAITGDQATFTPAPNFNGTTSFTFKANDGMLDSPTASIDVTVNPVNDPPVAIDVSATTDEDTEVQVTLEANDVEGDALTFAIAQQPESNMGTVKLNGSVATFTPAPDFRGVATFTFKASDGNSDSNEATATVQVASINDAPIAQDQSVRGDEDSPIVVMLTATDADGDPLTYSLVTPVPQGQGTVTLEGAVATYTPPLDFHGTTSFTFLANDGTLVSAPATISLEVKPVNDAPVAEGATATGLQGSPVTLTLHASDVDGDALTFSVKAQPANGAGTVTITGNQATFTPSPSFIGLTNFIFEVSDGMASSTATATITLDPAPIHSTGGGCGCGTASSGPILWIAAFALAAFARLSARRRS